MSNAFQTIAYHKNDAETAYKNTLLQAFFISHNKPEKELWLGDGIYFWERPEDAEWWPGGYLNETILEAVLSCQYDKFVNLDHKEEKEAFQQFCIELKRRLESMDGYHFDFSRGRFQVTSFFYNVFKETYDIMLMKYSFPERNNRPQYCATDNRCVSNIRIIARSIGNKWEWC